MSADVVCILSRVSPHRRFLGSVSRVAVTAVVALALAAGGFSARDVKAQTVNAQGAQAVRGEPPAPAAAWCLQRNESTEPPSCVYETFPSCFLAGFREGGYCISNPGPPAATVQPTDQAARRRVARSAPPPPRNGVSPAPNGQQTAQPTAQAPRQRTLTAAEREKIFNDFQRWREQRAEPKSEQRASTRGQQ
jgi:hypothetical protein